MIALLAALISPVPPQPVVLADGGFCFGLGWMHVADQKELRVMVDHAGKYIFLGYLPRDLWIIEYGTRSAIGIYDLEPLFRAGTVTVSKATSSGRFRGYVADSDGGWLNFIEGSQLDGGPADRAFLAKVSFDDAAKARCERHPPQ